MNINLIKNTLFLILLCPVLVSGVNVTFNVDMSQEDVGGEGPTLWMGFFYPDPGFIMTDDDEDGVWTYTVNNLDTGIYTYKYRNGHWTEWDTGNGWEDMSGQDCAVGPYSDREVVVGTDDMVVNGCFGFCIDGFCGGDDDGGWVLVWSDEFNGPEIDESKWGYDIGTGDWGWGNGEAQYYTNNANNSFIENGNLVIQALLQNYGGANYTSARMVTRYQGDWTYGRIEVRAKLPGGVGTWPAIWMLPTDWVYGGWPYSGEIDIMEHVGKNQGEIHGSVHYANEKNEIVSKTDTTYIDDVSEEFHVYSVDWNRDRIQFLVDNMVYHTFEISDAGSRNNPFRKPFFILINLALGGKWAGEIDDSKFPQKFLIDYVRVYQQIENKKAGL